MPTGFSVNKARSMATTSLGISIAAVVCLMSPGLTLGLSALGVIVALQSRGADCKLDIRAKIAIIVSIIAFVIAVALIVGAFLLLLKNFGGFDELMEYLMLRVQGYPNLSMP